MVGNDTISSTFLVRQFVALKFKELGFKIVSTEGTKRFFEKNNIKVELIKKKNEGCPNIVDAINNKEIVIIINTPAGESAAYDDSYIRKAAIKYKISYITTTAAALAAAEGINVYLGNKESVKSSQEYHKEIS